MKSVITCQARSPTPRSIITRPDTRPPVADEWAGAEMQLSAIKNVLKRLFYLFSTRADGRTDQRTDKRTKPLIELRVRN